MKLPRDFYERADVTQVSRELLGKKLCTFIDNQLVVVEITEVEAYAGRNDKACHANNNRITERTRVMYGRGGHAYVYLCYGIHHMFNVVTNRAGLADAVLIRAVEPLHGVRVMQQRRGKAVIDYKLTAGPGSVGKALGLNFKKHNGIDLVGDTIWIEDAPTLNEDDIFATTRVGIEYAEEDALKPWRFFIKDKKWISRK